MTDKQIIDEERMFECVWCKYGFKESDANFILSENPNECVCSGCITEWADNLLCDLKRKTQECEKLISEKDFYLQKIETLENKCEELKEEIINKNEKIKELRFSVSDLTNRFCDLNAEKSFRIVDLEQALKEIELSTTNLISSCDKCPDNKNGYCIGIDECSSRCFKNILNIINKAKDGNNE